jgi:hypothetical protein
MIGGVIAGAVMGRAWLCLSLTLSGLARESNLWGGILLLPLNILYFVWSDGYGPAMAMGGIFGVICALIYRRMLLGRRVRSY